MNETERRALEPIPEPPAQTLKTFSVAGAAGIITGQNGLDENDHPAGGFVHGHGFHVTWQNGPLGRGEDRKAPNGAFVEDVVTAVLERMRFYNDTKFRCRENSLAITKLEEALHWMQHRTQERERRGVEGTHVV